MDVKNYLDSTYLKTPLQAGLSKEQNDKIVSNFIEEAIQENFKLIMIRPDQVQNARHIIDVHRSNVLVGTVIDFPLGQSDLNFKLSEAEQAVDDGADELDFVCNYEGFKNGNFEDFEKEIFHCTKFALDHHKKVKWIIEVAALTTDEIIRITSFIRNIIMKSFDASTFENVFVKSSTGFFPTIDGKPNGATKTNILLMLENSGPLSVKAAGGVRTYLEAIEMIELGVKRIGTSSAKAIINGFDSNQAY